MAIAGLSGSIRDRISFLSASISAGVFILGIVQTSSFRDLGIQGFRDLGI
ncbi:hypothetical protein D1AOALGA4SA_7853 [Olavius algarvensis Delta 1 endosymbiont]|nr:hypothetical protein D1AOALGA4SA_7853 [Olavius algarvensis Delta 1 endosymbiont]